MNKNEWKILKNTHKTQLTPTSVLILCNASCAFSAAFRVKNVTKQHPETNRKTNILF